MTSKKELQSQIDSLEQEFQQMKKERDQFSTVNASLSERIESQDIEIKSLHNDFKTKWEYDQEVEKIKEEYRSLTESMRETIVRLSMLVTQTGKLP